MSYKKVSLLQQAADEARKACLYRALSATNGDVARAARNLGTNRTYCYQLLKRFGIKIERETRARVVDTRPPSLNSTLTPNSSRRPGPS